MEATSTNANIFTLNAIYIYSYSSLHINNGKKGKPVPLQAWIGPEGSQEIKVHRFHDNGTERW